MQILKAYTVLAREKKLASFIKVLNNIIKHEMFGKKHDPSYKLHLLGRFKVLAYKAKWKIARTIQLTIFISTYAKRALISVC